MKKILSKLQKLVTIQQLRAKYYRKPIELVSVSSQLGIQVDGALDLGSGPSPKNPFNASSVFGVDIRSYDINENVRKCFIGSDPLPFRDNHFEAVTAHDVLEHIPRIVVNKDERVFPFIFAMNEVWRVLKNGGLFYSTTPCYPMKEAFQDPTHVNIMTEDTLRLYFTEKAWARIYGFKGSFRLIIEGWNGAHYFCVLQKNSEIPVEDMNSPQKR